MKAVVTTIPRLLATLMVAAVLMLGVPVAPSVVASAATDPRPAHATASAETGPQALAGTKGDPASANPALPAASNGDQRVSLRDLPQKYLPVYASLPDIDGPWGRVPLPESVKAPDLAEPFALPLGRAPPLTARG